MSDFSKLPVGTMMVVRHGWTGRYLAPIEKVLKKHIVCGGVKWQIDGFNSMANASRFSNASISVATPEDIAAVQHADMAYRLSRVKWKSIDPQIVKTICDIAFPAKPTPSVENDKP